VVQRQGQGLPLLLRDPGLLHVDLRCTFFKEGVDSFYETIEMDGVYIDNAQYIT